MNTSSPKSVKIVLIDDNEDYLFTMETFLTRNGFSVATACNIQEGLTLIRNEQPNVILLDVMMESTYAGFELWKMLQADAALKEIPVIGISGMQSDLGVKPAGYPDQEYFQPAAFLEKPVDRDLLLKTIARVLKEAEEYQNRPQWQRALEKIKRQDPATNQ